MDHDLSTSGATRPRRTRRGLALMIALLLFAGYLILGYFIVPKIAVSWNDMLPGWWDLQLISAVKDVGGIPDKGDRLIIVADVDHVFRFRIFDVHGRQVVDTDETKLTSMAPRIGALRTQLAGFWPPQRPTHAERVQINTEVASIVGYKTPAMPTWVRVLANSNHFLFRYMPRLLAIFVAIDLFRRIFLAAKRRPRRLQIGLGTVLGTVVVFAVAIAWLNAWFFAPYRVERHAADALRRLGGKVVTVDQAPRWLRSYVGKDIFNMDMVTSADLSHSTVNDADLVHLRAFHHCGVINLSDTQVGNAGLIHFKNLATSPVLDLSRTRVTDVSVLLGRGFLNQFSKLNLSGNRITGNRVTGFERADVWWSPLQDLDLTDTDADDGTLKSLPDGLRSLSNLNLCGTNVTDDGLLSLLRMEGLKNLNLIDTKVTTLGVANLKLRWRHSQPLAILTGTRKKASGAPTNTAPPGTSKPGITR